MVKKKGFFTIYIGLVYVKDYIICTVSLRSKVTLNIINDLLVNS